MRAGQLYGIIEAENGCNASQSTKRKYSAQTPFLASRYLETPNDRLREHDRDKIADGIDAPRRNVKDKVVRNAGSRYTRVPSCAEGDAGEELEEEEYQVEGYVEEDESVDDEAEVNAGGLEG